MVSLPNLTVACPQPPPLSSPPKATQLSEYVHVSVSCHALSYGSQSAILYCNSSHALTITCRVPPLRISSLPRTHATIQYQTPKPSTVGFPDPTFLSPHTSSQSPTFTFPPQNPRGGRARVVTSLGAVSWPWVVKGEEDIVQFWCRWLPLINEMEAHC